MLKIFSSPKPTPTPADKVAAAKAGIVEAVDVAINAMHAFDLVDVLEAQAARVRARHATSASIW
jgi:hypothetical protein